MLLVCPAGKMTEGVCLRLSTLSTLAEGKQTGTPKPMCAKDLELKDLPFG